MGDEQALSLSYGISWPSSFMIIFFYGRLRIITLAYLCQFLGTVIWCIIYALICFSLLVINIHVYILKNSHLSLLLQTYLLDISSTFLTVKCCPQVR
jgi:hypothetical protein